MRTPSEIFEEVLCLWDRERARRGLLSADEVQVHAAALRGYRDEFRGSMRGAVFLGMGPGSAASYSVPPEPVAASPTEAFWGPADHPCLGPAEGHHAGMLVVDDPAGPEPDPAKVEESYDMMAALKASLLQRRPDPFDRRAEHESIPERAERLAERLTWPDGSPR